LGLPWSAKRVDGAWKFTTKKKLMAGAKANLAKEINKKIRGEA